MGDPTTDARRANERLRQLESESITTSWLASRVGIEPERLDVLRRAGKLLGVRPPGSLDHLYPGWQFGVDGKPLPAIPRIVAAAREAGLDELRLYELMTNRVGLLDRRRLVDMLREGREEHVLDAIRTAGSRHAARGPR